MKLSAFVTAVATALVLASSPAAVVTSTDVLAAEKEKKQRPQLQREGRAANSAPT